MNRINPKKLLDSKWSAVKPVDKEKHFILVGVEYGDDASVVKCVLEAVMTKRRYTLELCDLKDPCQWLHGWK